MGEEKPTKKAWEKEVTKNAETKVKEEETKTKRLATEKSEIELWKWEEECKTTKNKATCEKAGKVEITSAQRKEKEKTQETNRKTKETEEKTANTARENAEKTTKTNRETRKPHRKPRKKPEKESKEKRETEEATLKTKKLGEEETTKKAREKAETEETEEATTTKVTVESGTCRNMLIPAVIASRLARVRERARDARGFTLIETLVAILTGIVVTAALFAILEVSLHQSARAADVVQASQLGRATMTRMVDELRSSCLATEFTPIQEKSSNTELYFRNSYSEKAVPTSASEHKIVLERKNGRAHGLHVSLHGRLVAELHLLHHRKPRRRDADRRTHRGSGHDHRQK